MIIRRDRLMLAVLIVLDVAFHAGRASTVSAAEIAERAGLARRGIEPLLQTLARSGLLESVRGPKGGYRLGRARRDIRLADIVRIASAEEADLDDGPRRDLLQHVLDPLWLELDGTCMASLGQLTVDDLVKRAGCAGLVPPATEPIVFSI